MTRHVSAAAESPGYRLSSHLTTALLIITGVLLIPISVLAQNKAPKDAQPSPQASPAPSSDELIQLHKRLRELTAEVSRLNAELAKLERYKTIDYTRDLMLKEEQRVRDLQNELVSDAAKETLLQKRLDEIEEQQRPDRIERSLAGVGSVKPEEDRNAIARRLSNEKRQIESQLETLRAARARIPPMIANAQDSIARLKQRLTEISHH